MHSYASAAEATLAALKGGDAVEETLRVASLLEGPVRTETHNPFRPDPEAVGADGRAG